MGASDWPGGVDLIFREILFLGAFYSSKGLAKKPFGTPCIKIAKRGLVPNLPTYLPTQIPPTFYTEPTRLHPKTENPCF